MYKSGSPYLIGFGLTAGLLMIYLLFSRTGLTAALFFAVLPVIALVILGVSRKQYIYYAFFILNYVIMGIDRYIPLKSGMIMTVLAAGILVFILAKNIIRHQEWYRCKNFLTLTWGLWFLYCFLEVFNPQGLTEPWSIAMPNYAFYPLFCAVAVPVLFTRYAHFRWLLVIWAVLTLLAAAKGYWQRNHGFDATELHWLYNGGGGKTHLIYSGIRFFSFFTDAAAYGASMGLSLVVFGISGFYISKWPLKLLFWLAALGGGYGLVISGTRSDLAIPFVGLALYLVLCRDVKAIVITAVLLGGTFVFLNYTTIGDGNRLIRRMRTAFDSEDASWLVRVGHKKRIVRLMQDKPFGVGLGLAGNKASRFRPESKHDPLTYLATDSWYIMTFIETGIVGLILYLTVLAAILLQAIRTALFRIVHRELRGQLYAIIAAIAGILVTCYANEVLNYPNGILVYTLMACLYIAPYYDEELTRNEQPA